MPLPALGLWGIIASGFTWLIGVIGTGLMWLAGRTAQRIGLFLVMVAVIAGLLTSIDTSLRTLLGTVALQVPDLGYFFYLLLPDNFPSVVSTYLTAEIMLAVYRWGFWLTVRKVYIPT